MCVYVGGDVCGGWYVTYVSEVRVGVYMGGDMLMGGVYQVRIRTGD